MADALANMKKETLLNGVSATGESANAQWADQDRAHSFFVSITDTATVAIQSSPDGSTWFAEATLTSSDIVDVNAARPYLRANVTAYTAGTVTVTHTSYCRN